jgi:hypothetical protein
VAFQFDSPALGGEVQRLIACGVRRLRPHVVMGGKPRAVEP